MKIFILVNDRVKYNCIEAIKALETGKSPVMTVEIKKQKKLVSCPQRGYYWGIVLKAISEFTGHTADELHEAFMFQWFPTQVVHVGSLKREIRQSSEKLEVSDYGRLIDLACAFAATELGLHIPLPRHYGLDGGK